MENKYQKEMAQLIAKAWTDPAFKEKLLKQPKEAFLEMGIPAPEGVNIHVVENSQKDWNFVLPMKPEGELSEIELRDAAGGGCCVDFSGPVCG